VGGALTSPQTGTSAELSLGESAFLCPPTSKHHTRAPVLPTQQLCVNFPAILAHRAAHLNAVGVVNQLVEDAIGQRRTATSTRCATPARRCRVVVFLLPVGRDVEMLGGSEQRCEWDRTTG
jgi:hypothetical protein